IGANTGGDYYLLHLQTGAIYYWDGTTNPESPDPSWIAESIGDLVSRLRYLPGEGPELVDEIEAVGEDGSIEELEALLQRRALDTRSTSGLTVAEAAARG